MAEKTGCAKLIPLAILLFVLWGCCIVLTPFSGPWRLPGRINPSQKYPLPHHVAKYPGNVTMRFAMVHDTIHERYPVHGPAYYKKRNEITEEALKKETDLQPAQGPPKKRYFDLQDDLAVGLMKLGQFEKATDMVAKKLEVQKKLGLTGKDLYSSYANLGTFLILWQLNEGFGDLPKAKARLKESIANIHKAIEVYPESHFGREIWQVVLEEFILASLDDPKILLKYDMVGNNLDPSFYLSGQSASMLNYYAFPKKLLEPLDSLTNEERDQLRRLITRVGAEAEWAKEVPTSHKEQVPFDDPALGIIGMWRMGGGANPFFAVALGEIMLRVGQRNIAWTAYERAALMAKNYSADPEIAAKFLDHCRSRQKLIEETLPQEQVEKLRPQFEKELAYGMRYQKAYQDYETKRIAEGADLNDEHFYDAFYAAQGPIASRSGEEEFLVIGERPSPWPEVILCVGFVAFGLALLFRLRRN